MNTKLTLSMDAKAIELAKKHSKRKGISVSKMVENYFKDISASPVKNKKGSLMDLKGILGPVPIDYDYGKERDEYLMKKHK